MILIQGCFIDEVVIAPTSTEVRFVDTKIGTVTILGDDEGDE